MFKAVRKFVTVPYLLNEIVKTRWSELGYRSFSGYLVGLIRYDLLIGGKHTLTAQMGSDAPDIQDAIDREIATTYRAGGTKSTYLDHLIDRTRGEEMTQEARDEVKARIANLLRKKGK